jgi:hypothetical protein
MAVGFGPGVSTITMTGSTSGTATITTQAAAGTPTLTLPTGSGYLSLTTDPSGAAPVVNSSAIQPITASVASNALTITLGATVLSFRSATLTNGTPTTLTIASPISITVPTGASLGTVGTIQSRIVVLCFNNSGTPVLAVANLYGGFNFDETVPTTATLISSGSTASSIAYGSVNVGSNQPFRVVGYVESTQATAGTWATAPSTVQGMGGQALTAMSSIGYSQKWQAIGRSTGVTYYNTTGRPIMISYTANCTNGTTVLINGTDYAVIFNPQPYVSQVTVIVPAGASYLPSCPFGGLQNYAELR